MKFTDTNGIEIECTPAEYLELQKSKNNSKNKVKIPTSETTPGKRKLSRYINWKERMVKVKALIDSNKNETFSITTINDRLKYGCGKAAVKLKNELMKDDTIKKITKCKRIKFTSLLSKENGMAAFSKKYKRACKPAKPNDLRRKRFKFINDRCKYLQIQNIHMSREKALSIASGEWNNKGKIKKVKIDEDAFPALYGVSANSENFIIARVSECISHNRKMGYFDFKEVCEWESGVTWIHFINSFLNNKRKISKYFSVPDKFRTAKIKGYDYIIYGDN